MSFTIYDKRAAIDALDQARVAIVHCTASTLEASDLISRIGNTIRYIEELGIEEAADGTVHVLRDAKIHLIMEALPAVKRPDHIIEVIDHAIETLRSEDPVERVQELLRRIHDEHDTLHGTLNGYIEAISALVHRAQREARVA